MASIVCDAKFSVKLVSKLDNWLSHESVPTDIFHDWGFWGHPTAVEKHLFVYQPGLRKARLFRVSEESVKSPPSPSIFRLRASCSSNRLKKLSLRKIGIVWSLKHRQTSHQNKQILHKLHDPAGSQLVLATCSQSTDQECRLTFSQVARCHDPTTFPPTSQSKGKCCQHRLNSQNSDCLDCSQI